MGRNISRASARPPSTPSTSPSPISSSRSPSTCRRRRSKPGGPTSLITCCALEPPQLPEAFENETFDFWQRYLTGAKEQRPRTARCVAAVDRALGDLLGQKYIELTFGADAKAQITQLVDALEKAMAEDIRTLPWMTEETKKAALAKLKAITNNVGYSQEVARLRAS